MIGAYTLRRGRLDLPLERDGSGRFLPWIIALMIYLATLALAGMMALHGAVVRWNDALAGTLTIQLPAGAAAALPGVLALARATPGVTRAEPLDEAANAALLRPWLGADGAVNALPLPRLVDLRLDPRIRFDRPTFAAHLAAAAPAARLADNQRWLDRAAGTIRAAEALAGAIVALVAAAAIISTVFATRTGLAIHHGTVEVLHLIGAQDAYIADQFQWQALRLGLRGGMVGLLAAALTLLLLGRIAGEGAAAIDALPRFALGAAEWAWLLVLPPAAGLVALATARLTVLRALAAMP